MMIQPHFQQIVDTSSLNAFTSSYHKIIKSQKENLQEKLNLPALNGSIFLNAKINVKPIIKHVEQAGNKGPLPIFTFQAWAKLKSEVRSMLKKSFHQKLKEIHLGNLIRLQPGESLHVRTDHFCLSPHPVYTVLIPLNKCDLNSSTIGVCTTSVNGIGSQVQLLQKLHRNQAQWIYSVLTQGDMVIIGRDCIYGSFRNDTQHAVNYLEMRWVKHDSSSSSSNSS